MFIVHSGVLVAASGRSSVAALSRWAGDEQHGQRRAGRAGRAHEEGDLDPGVRGQVAGDDIRGAMMLGGAMSSEIRLPGAWSRPASVAERPKPSPPSGSGTSTNVLTMAEPPWQQETPLVLNGFRRIATAWQLQLQGRRAGTRSTVGITRNHKRRSSRSIPLRRQDLPRWRLRTPSRLTSHFALLLVVQLESGRAFAESPGTERRASGGELAQHRRAGKRPARLALAEPASDRFRGATHSR
jgi:hypothetical protein